MSMIYKCDWCDRESYRPDGVDEALGQYWYRLRPSLFACTTRCAQALILDGMSEVVLAELLAEIEEHHESDSLAG